MSDETLISKNDKAKMQQTAASNEKPQIEDQQPHAEADDAKPSAEQVKVAKKAEAKPAMNKLAIGVMVTLDLTNLDQFEENNDLYKSALTKVEIEGSGEAANLFNPFRPVNKKVKAKDPEAARGLLRNAMTSVFSIASELEGQNIVFLGKRADQVALMRSTADALRDRVQSALGFSEDFPLIATPATDDETGAAVTLKFSDVIRVTAWANVQSAALDLAVEAEAGITSNIFINLTVNAGSLYSATELDNAVGQVASYLEQVSAKFEEDSGYAPLILLGLALRGNSLADGRVVELVNTLNANDNYDLYDRHDLIQAAAQRSADWVPTSKAGIEQQLLPATADMLYLAILPDEGEEEGESEE